MSADHLLLGYPMPPQPSTNGLLSWWLPEPLFTAAVGAAFLYLAAVRRLHRRGEGWPLRRTLAWLSACVIVVAATSTRLARYAPVLLSVHVLQFLLLTVVAPLLSALAVPTILGRAVRLPPSGTHEWPGPREWLQAIAHSAAARLLTRPAVAVVTAAGGLPVVYFGGLYEATLRSPAAHLTVSLCSTGLGLLFFHLLFGGSPRPEARMRSVALAGAGVYAVVAVSFLCWAPHPVTRGSPSWPGPGTPPVTRTAPAPPC